VSVKLVGSPILAVSVTWGVSTLLLTAVPAYLLAGLVFPDGPARPGAPS
jgi:hypothetical protein